MNESTLPDGLDEFAAGLRALAPAPVELDRDQLMFAAGLASVQSTPAKSAALAWGWPLATAALLLVSVALAWQWRTAAAQPERIVYVQVPTATPASPAREPQVPPMTAGGGVLDRSNYLSLRQRILNDGVESLADNFAAGSDSSTIYAANQYRELLNASEGD